MASASGGSGTTDVPATDRIIIRVPWGCCPPFQGQQQQQPPLVPPAGYHFPGAPPAASTTGALDPHNLSNLVAAAVDQRIHPQFQGLADVVRRLLEEQRTVALDPAEYQRLVAALQAAVTTNTVPQMEAALAQVSAALQRRLTDQLQALQQSLTDSVARSSAATLAALQQHDDQTTVLRGQVDVLRQTLDRLIQQQQAGAVLPPQIPAAVAGQWTALLDRQIAAQDALERLLENFRASANDLLQQAATVPAEQRAVLQGPLEAMRRQLDELKLPDLSQMLRQEVRELAAARTQLRQDIQGLQQLRPSAETTAQWQQLTTRLTQLLDQANALVDRNLAPLPVAQPAVPDARVEGIRVALAALERSQANQDQSLQAIRNSVGEALQLRLTELLEELKLPIAMPVPGTPIQVRPPGPPPAGAAAHLGEIRVLLETNQTDMRALLRQIEAALAQRNDQARRQAENQLAAAQAREQQLQADLNALLPRVLAAERVPAGDQRLIQLGTAVAALGNSLGTFSNENQAAVNQLRNEVAALRVAQPAAVAPGLLQTLDQRLAKLEQGTTGTEQLRAQNQQALQRALRVLEEAEERKLPVAEIAALRQEVAGLQRAHQAAEAQIAQAVNREQRLQQNAADLRRQLMETTQLLRDARGAGPQNRQVTDALEAMTGATHALAEQLQALQLRAEQTDAVLLGTSAADPGLLSMLLGQRDAIIEEMKSVRAAIAGIGQNLSAPTDQLTNAVRTLQDLPRQVSDAIRNASARGGPSSGAATAAVGAIVPAVGILAAEGRILDEIQTAVRSQTTDLTGVATSVQALQNTQAQEFRNLLQQLQNRVPENLARQLNQLSQDVAAGRTRLTPEMQAELQRVLLQPTQQAIQALGAAVQKSNNELAAGWRAAAEQVAAQFQQAVLRLNAASDIVEGRTGQINAASALMQGIANELKDNTSPLQRNLRQLSDLATSVQQQLDALDAAGIGRVGQSLGDMLAQRIQTELANIVPADDGRLAQWLNNKILQVQAAEQRALQEGKIASGELSATREAIVQLANSLRQVGTVDAASLLAFRKQVKDITDAVNSLDPQQLAQTSADIRATRDQALLQMQGALAELSTRIATLAPAAEAKAAAEAQALSAQQAQAALAAAAGQIPVAAAEAVAKQAEAHRRQLQGIQKEFLEIRKLLEVKEGGAAAASGAPAAAASSASATSLAELSGRVHRVETLLWALLAFLGVDISGLPAGASQNLILSSVAPFGGARLVGNQQLEALTVAVKQYKDAEMQRLQAEVQRLMTNVQLPRQQWEELKANIATLSVDLPGLLEAVKALKNLEGNQGLFLKDVRTETNRLIQLARQQQDMMNRQQTVCQQASAGLEALVAQFQRIATPGEGNVTAAEPDVNALPPGDEDIDQAVGPGGGGEEVKGGGVVRCPSQYPINCRRRGQSTGLAPCVAAGHEYLCYLDDINTNQGRQLALGQIPVPMAQNGLGWSRFPDPAFHQLTTNEAAEGEIDDVTKRVDARLWIPDTVAAKPNLTALFKPGVYERFPVDSSTGMRTEAQRTAGALFPSIPIDVNVGSRKRHASGQAVAVAPPAAVVSSSSAAAAAPAPRPPTVRGRRQSSRRVFQQQPEVPFLELPRLQEEEKAAAAATPVREEKAAAAATPVREERAAAAATPVRAPATLPAEEEGDVSMQQLLEEEKLDTEEEAAARRRRSGKRRLSLATNVASQQQRGKVGTISEAAGSAPAVAQYPGSIINSFEEARTVARAVPAGWDEHLPENWSLRSVSEGGIVTYEVTINDDMQASLDQVPPFPQTPNVLLDLFLVRESTIPNVRVGEFVTSELVSINPGGGLEARRLQEAQRAAVAAADAARGLPPPLSYLRRRSVLSAAAGASRSPAPPPPPVLPYLRRRSLIPYRVRW